MKKIELGAIGFSAEFKNGELAYGSPRIEILQDNMREVAADVPDGKYNWVLVLDLEKAEKTTAQLTIGEVIERGWIECPKCNSRRSVGSEGEARGMVSDCAKCGESGYWNLFVEAL